jgi:hypothetical protein
MNSHQPLVIESCKQGLKDDLEGLASLNSWRSPDSIARNDSQHPSPEAESGNEDSMMMMKSFLVLRTP